MITLMLLGITRMCHSLDRKISVAPEKLAVKTW